MLRSLRLAVRRFFPRRSHPLLDKPVVPNGFDERFAARYASELQHDPDGDSPFVRERYREGMRWRQVVEEISRQAPKRVLDVGAGNGAVALAMAATSERIVIAIDTLLNATMHRLMALAPRGTHIVGDGLALPLADGCIDVVLCLETIEHIPPHALAGFGAEMIRVLNRDGLILITTPPRWRYILRGDPHFDIPGLLLLPTRAQRAVAARRGFSESHHFVGKIYSSVRRIHQAFPGFNVEVLSRSRAPRRWIWDALVLRRSKN
jgi:SAM-dependent methyltransferase